MKNQFKLKDEIIPVIEPQLGQNAIENNLYKRVNLWVVVKRDNLSDVVFHL